jgi:hypothetical protein
VGSVFGVSGVNDGVRVGIQVEES